MATAPPPRFFPDAASMWRTKTLRSPRPAHTVFDPSHLRDKAATTITLNHPPLASSLRFQYSHPLPEQFNPPDSLLPNASMTYISILFVEHVNYVLHSPPPVSSRSTPFGPRSPEHPAKYCTRAAALSRNADVYRLPPPRAARKRPQAHFRILKHDRRGRSCGAARCPIHSTRDIQSQSNPILIQTQQH